MSDIVDMGGQSESRREPGYYDKRPVRPVVERSAPEPTDPMHPNGKCRCHGEGACEWCRKTEEPEG